MLIKNNLKQKGVVILFAVLMVSVILTISLGVFNIVYRQLLLSSMARESEISYVVADSARNCALYWNSDFRPDANTTTGTKFGFFEYVAPADPSRGWKIVFPISISVSFSCGGNNINLKNSVDNANKVTTEFVFPMTIPDPVNPSNPRKACATVVVEKVVASTVLTQNNVITTTITANGYNIQDTTAGGDGCTPQSTSNLNRAVERTLVSVIHG